MKCEKRLPQSTGITVVGAVLLTILYGRLTLERMKAAVLKALATSSLVLFLAVASNIYGSVFARLGTASLITDTILALPISPMAMIVVLMAVNLQTAFLSPPVAMAAYYLKGVAPDWDLGKIYNGMIRPMVL